MNVNGLLFLRQCLNMLPPSTETSISGTSHKLPLWNLVSQNVYWRMTWLDVNSCYCDWWVQSGGLGWCWLCDVKMVEWWCWRMQEIECSSLAHCNNVLVCDKRWYSHERSLWYFMLFWPLWDFLMTFHTFSPLSQTRWFQSSWGLGVGVGSKEVMQRHA